MSKKALRAISAGVGAGLAQLAGSMQQGVDQERVDKRLAKEDAFKDRQLKMQEESLAIAREQADRAKREDRIKMLHGRTVSALAGKTDPREILNILSGNNTGNLVPTNFTFNDAARSEKENLNPDGTPVWAVADISYNEVYSDTGEIVPDPVTGGPKQRRVDDKRLSRKVWKTQAEFERFKFNRLNPMKWMADGEAKWTADLKYQQAAEAAEVNRKQAALDDESYNKTETGRAKLAKTRSETAENVANAEKLRAESVTKQETKLADDTVLKNFDGSELRYNRNAITLKRDELETMQDSFPGMDLQEKVNYEQGMPKIQKEVKVIVMDVVRNADDKGAKADAIEWIRNTLRVKRSVAEGILQDEMKGVESDEPSWWQKLTSGFSDEAPAGN